MEKINVVLSQLSGALILLTGCLAVFEVVMRHFLSSPTIWTADVSQYLLIWTIFMASGYAFQEHGHVKVDLFTEYFPLPLRRLCAIAAYAFSIGFTFILFDGSYIMFANALRLGAKTYAVVQIPKWVLILGMLIGCVNMLATLLCIIADIWGGNEKYL